MKYVLIDFLWRKTPYVLIFLRAITVGLSEVNCFVSSQGIYLGACREGISSIDRHGAWRFSCLYFSFFLSFLRVPCSPLPLSYPSTIPSISHRYPIDIPNSWSWTKHTLSYSKQQIEPMASPRVTKSPAKKPQAGRSSSLLDKHHEFLMLCIEGSTATVSPAKPELILEVC